MNEFFKKVWNWIKEHWMLLVGAIASVFAFILGSSRRRDRILDDATKRSDEFRSDTTECRDSITESRIENQQSSDRIESSTRIVEEIKQSNDSITGAIGDAREQVSDLKSAIDARIEQLKASKDN